MKNITKSLIALFTVLAISCSSDDVEDRPVITGIDAPVMAAPEGNNGYVLSVENAANQAERFVWSSANYDTDVAIIYTVEIDTAGNEFANPQSLGSVTGANQLSVSVETMNGVALALGANPFESKEFEVRIKASVNDTFEPMYSNVASISITPYTTESPKLWVPGGYQAASGYGDNWAHATAPLLASEGFGNTKFEGYVYFATAQDGSIDGQGFKFSNQANWDGTNYGDDGSFSGVLSATGGNMSIAAGYYRVEADTNALTYKMTNTTWGVIGNSTPGGWENSTPMTYDATTKKWTVIVAMTAQTAPDNGWKFRANNAWEINLGDTTVNSTDGTLRYGGDNIGITADGTYKIELDLSNPRAYTYTITLQ